MINIALKIIKAEIKNRFRKFLRGVSLPYKVTLIFTYLCDSRCQICNIWKIYKDAPKKVEEELKNEELYKVISSLKENLVWLNVTGGEPLLRKDLAELVSKLYHNCKNLRFINIPINGLNPSLAKETFSKICQGCPEALVYVSLSLDGLKEDYQYIRGVDSFEIVLETYSQLKGLNLKNLVTLFGITLSKFNIDSIFKTVEFLKSLKAKYIITFALELKLFHNKGSGTDLRMIKAEAISCLKGLEKGYKINLLEEFLPKAYLRLGRLFLKYKVSPLGCSAGYSTITIDPYGNVLPCPFREIVYGNVKDYGFDLPRLISNPHKVRNELGDCRLCWQSCQVYPSILSRPFKTIYLYFKSKL